MSNERFFRMLSVAILGLCALVAVPDSNATDAQVAATAETTNALPIEITVVREVEDINAGRFNPAAIGDESEDAFFIASSVLTTTISQIDPNL
jgi:hypothetical protein